MEAIDILLKCLKSKRYIDDIELARKEVTTEHINLKKEDDMFIRDSIIGLGTVLKEDLDEHYYITTVRMGFFGNVLTHAIILRQDSEADIAVHVHEGLVKQHLAEKTIEKIKKLLAESR